MPSICTYAFLIKMAPTRRAIDSSRNFNQSIRSRPMKWLTSSLISREANALKMPAPTAILTIGFHSASGLSDCRPDRKANLNMAASITRICALRCKILRKRFLYLNVKVEGKDVRSAPTELSGLMLQIDIQRRRLLPRASSQTLNSTAKMRAHDRDRNGRSEDDGGEEADGQDAHDLSKRIAASILRWATFPPRGGDTA